MRGEGIIDTWLKNWWLAKLQSRWMVLYAVSVQETAQRHLVWGNVIVHAWIRWGFIKRQFLPFCLTLAPAHRVHSTFREMFVFLVSHPPPVSFEIWKNNFCFANVDGVFFSTDIGIEMYLGCFLPGCNSAHNTIIITKSRYSHQKITHSKEGSGWGILLK